MPIRIAHATILSVFALFFLVLIQSSVVYAACNTPAICDPNGVTCNGGQPCIVGIWVIGSCADTYTCDCTVAGGSCTTKCTNCCGGTISTCSATGQPCSNPGGPCGDDLYGRGTCLVSYAGSCDPCIVTNVCDEVVCVGEVALSTCTPDNSTCTPTCSPACGQPDGCGGTCPNSGGAACGPVCPNGNCEAGEDCNSCSADCPCGGGGGDGGGSGGAFCGDDTCNDGESCSNCSKDCGLCGLSCGDGICSGFETCGSCVADCGACALDGAAWFQVSGNLLAELDISTAIRSPVPGGFCLPPLCILQLIAPDDTLAVESEGVAVTGGGDVDAGGFVSSSNAQAVGTATTRLKENYAFFYREYSLGLNPSDDFTGSAEDARKPVSPPSGGKSAYYHKGDLTIQSHWDVNSGEAVVIFVDGDLTLSDPDGLGSLVRVEQGGFLALVVSGDITIDSSVGNADLGVENANIEGVFIADGVLRTESGGSGDDKRLVAEGTYVGWGGVELRRDLGAANNTTIPAEVFIYRPDFLVNTPERMKRPRVIWQETN